MASEPVAEVLTREAGRRPTLGVSRQAVSRVTVMAIRCAAMALNFAVQLVMARAMGLSAFGSANTALALLNILVIPAGLGYETTAIRYVALTRADQPVLRALTVRFARTVMLGSLLTCLFVGAAAAIQLALGHADSAVGLAMLVVIIPGFAFVRVGEAWLRGFGCLVRALVNSGVVIPVVSILLILAQKALLGSGATIGVAGALGARALATGVAVAAVAVFVVGKLQGHLRPRASLESAWVSEIHRVALVLCGVAVLTMAVSQMDIIAVSFLRGSAEAGVYSAASRVAQAMNIALVAVNFVLAPRIARLFADGKSEQLQHEVSSAASWSTCLMATGCAFLIPASPLVLSVFGSGFGGASDALRILMLGQLVNATCGPAGAVLSMTGGQWKAIRALGLAAAIDVVLFGVLIPPLGLTGAACATAICTATWNAGMLTYIRRDMRIWSLPGPLARALP
jgi:O-antigen/teichoic acid export membrane protein